MKPLPENFLNKMSPADRRPMGKAGVTNAEALAKFEAKNERELQKQIAAYLRRHNIWFAQSRTDKRTTNGLGQPDFLLSTYPDGSSFPQPYALEVKFRNGKLSDEQEEVRQKMIRCGWHYQIVRSLKEVIELLKL